VDPHAEGGARILIKESDRDMLRLERSSTDILMSVFKVRTINIWLAWTIYYYLVMLAIHVTKNENTQKSACE
jgi:hypothetical protein